MNKSQLIDDLLQDISLQLPCGGLFLDFNQPSHLKLLESALDNRGINVNNIATFIKEIQLEPSKDKIDKLNKEDVELLKRLGLDMPDGDIEQIDINNFDETKVIFDTGSGHRVFSIKKLSYNQIFDFIQTQEVCYATTSKTINKLRSQDNIRIIEWKPTRGQGIGSYEQILAVFKLIKFFGNKIILSKRAPQGIQYEMSRVEEINKVLDTSVLPFRLFIEKDGLVKDMGVSVKKARKIVGVGKADIALLDKHDSEVFWLSYKHGDFFGKEGEIAKYVPFQQYGSLQTLYDKTISENEEDVDSADIRKIINHFIDSVINKSDLNKYSLYNVEEVTGTPDGNYELHFKNNDRKIIDTNHKLFKIFDDVTYYRKLVKFLDKGSGNIHFYLQGTPEHYFNFLKSKLLEPKILRNIAGKTIYGMDFFDGNVNFGRENVNILLQTSRVLEIKQHKFAKNTDVEEVDGIIIKTDKLGHILFNPNLPDEDIKNTFRIMDRYTPTIYIRFTTNETFRWNNETGRNIILGGRCMVIPKGKIKSTAIEII